MFGAQKMQRACPRCQTWLLQVFENGAGPAAATAVSRKGSVPRRCLSTAASRTKRVSSVPSRGLSTSGGPNRQLTQSSETSASPDLKEMEAVVRQAKATFGDTLPQDYLTSQEYQLYERLYGSPLRETRPEDVSIPLERLQEQQDAITQQDVINQQDATNTPQHTLLRELEGVDLEEVDYKVAGEQEDAEPAALAETVDIDTALHPFLENAPVEYINAVVRNKREYRALLKLQRDFEAAATREAARLAEEERRATEEEQEEEEEEEDEEEKDEEENEEEEEEEEEEEPGAVFDMERAVGGPVSRVHPLTVMARSQTYPTTLQLPKATFVEPVTDLLRRTDAKHIQLTAEKAFGGYGLPFSPASPRRSRHSVPQKAIPIEAGHHRMSEIEADTYLATVMPGVYAAAMHALVEVRRRLGAGWLRGLHERQQDGGGGVRVLDAGGGGAAMAAWNEVLRAGIGDESRKEKAVKTDKFVVVGSDALRYRVSRFLHNTTFLPRLPDLLHSAANVERHLDAPASVKPRKTYDVIVASHLLMPLARMHQRRALVANLWEQLNPDGGVLIVLEKGHPRGFEAVAEARRRLLEFVESPGVEEAEDSIEPEDVRPREPGSIVAPCTSHGKCPMYLTPGLTTGRKDFCRFSQRFIRPSYLQKVLGNSHRNHEDVEFSYVAVQRGRPAAAAADALPRLYGRTASDAAFAGYEHTDPADPATTPHPLSLPRTVLAPLKRHGHVILDVCTPAGQLERWTVPRSLSRQAYHDARKAQWGDLWALGAKTRVARPVRLGRGGAGADDRSKPSLDDVGVDAAHIRGAKERGRGSRERLSKKERRKQEREQERELLEDLEAM